MTVNYPLIPHYDRDVSSLQHFPKGVIVFDRDGTLVEDAGQHNDKSFLKFLPGAIDSIKILSNLNYAIAIATNQAGVESGKFKMDKVSEFNESLCAILREEIDAGIDLIAICPHLASTNCQCRKPKTGLLEGIEDSGLGKLKLFVGNSESDRKAAVDFRLEFVHTNGSDLLSRIKDWTGLHALS
jgi:D-glycero-D-manno-heptose 1,7-bisphosphate phosphatase